MIFNVMGVTACGKTTLSKALAEALGLPFVDGDDLHPEANRRKMADGDPLDDADREPWLRAVAEEMVRRESASEGEAGGAVFACSALKQSYRETLRSGGAPIRFVYMRCTPELAERRALAREDHEYINKDISAIVAGQFRDLEEPEDAFVVEVAEPTDGQLASVLYQIAKDKTMPRSLRERAGQKHGTVTGYQVGTD